MNGKDKHHRLILVILTLTISMLTLIFFSYTHISRGQVLPMISGTTNLISQVEMVKITAFNVTDNRNIIVGLSYNGSGQSPGVSLLAIAESITPQEINAIISPFLGINNSESATFPQNNNNQLLSSLEILTGTSNIEPGWNSPISEAIPLQGNTTLKEANVIYVQVLPSVG